MIDDYGGLQGNTPSLEATMGTTRGAAERLPGSFLYEHTESVVS